MPEPLPEAARERAASPLSAADLQILADAKARGKKIRRAAGVAHASAWTLAVFGGLTMLAVAFGDFVALALGVLLCALAFNEFRGGAMLKRFDPRGARVLGFNQIALGVVIVAYASYSLSAALRDPALKSLAGSTGDPSTDALVRDLTDLVTYGLYGGMAVIGLIAPGLTALYYFSRAAIVRKVVSETPAWAIEAIRVAA